MGYPDIWQNIILTVSVKMPLGDFNILIGRLNKADCSTPYRWVSSNQVKACMEQKG